ncbi:hypothetical protein C8A01DRAFT_32286 [Parachaetomium inaequale]|uniref:Uncharacterized protein n=1 Tax=Parachaetomium inaequale TaxID=2588326 RepID=A0AAN6PQS5_9PEZI|nr:hypothetical protein C8A01DRAFT_32286 [Parachaetomium inaequale]
MKLSWLVPVLVGGGAAAGLDKVGIVSDKVAEVKVLLKGVTYQRQARNPEGASIQSPSANAVTVDLDTLNIALPNRTKPKLTIQREDQHDEALPVITLRTTTANNAPPDTQDSSTQQTELPLPSDYDSDVDEALSSSASNAAAETGNPASANRAIAGMGVGLVSVMLIFTVFL